jgi:hypothetical protein
MNKRSQARNHLERLRAMASEAPVPSTTAITVVQQAMVKLFQAARCIWSASSRA